MKNEKEKTLNPTPVKPKRIRYDVGYCKPPRNSWFLPGTSGNPKGRPTGSKNKPKDSKLTEILREELFCETESELRGEKENVSIVRLVTQMLVDSALDGNFRAQQWVLSATSAVEAADAAEQEADYQYAKVYKEEHGGIFFRDETLELVPNPDQIYLDNRHRRALFACARNAEEMAEFEEIRAEAKRSGTEVGEAVDSADQELADPEKESNQGAESLDCSAAIDPSTEAGASAPDVEMPRGPLPSTSGDPPYEGDDERIPRHTPDEGEDERLRRPIPDEGEDERLRRPTPDEREDERLRKPTS